jgi:hypothetical protein
MNIVAHEDDLVAVVMTMKELVAITCVMGMTNVVEVKRMVKYVAESGQIGGAAALLTTDKDYDAPQVYYPATDFLKGTFS